MHNYYIEMIQPLYLFRCNCAVEAISKCIYILSMHDEELSIWLCRHKKYFEMNIFRHCSSKKQHAALKYKKEECEKALSLFCLRLLLISAISNWKIFLICIDVCVPCRAMPHIKNQVLHSKNVILFHPSTFNYSNRFSPSSFAKATKSFHFHVMSMDHNDIHDIVTFHLIFLMSKWNGIPWRWL